MINLQPRPKHALTVATLLLLFTGGCQSQTKSFSGSKGKAYDDIAQITIVNMTPLLDANLDGVPDGVFIHVYLLRRGNLDLPVPGKGRMEFRLIDRTGGRGEPADKVLKTWEISPEQMAASPGQGAFGPCHKFELYWEDVHTDSPRIFLQGEFIRPDKLVATSSLVSLTLHADVPPTTTKSVGR
jgi:hypothetical protein